MDSENWPQVAQVSSNIASICQRKKVIAVQTNYSKSEFCDGISNWVMTS